MLNGKFIENGSDLGLHVVQLKWKGVDFFYFVK